jgi:ribosomal protein S18 acetylase RimI-like enzyme
MSLGSFRGDLRRPDAREERMAERQLIVEISPRPEDARFLEDRLYEFNVQATGIADGSPLAVLLRGPDGKVAGGAYGWSWGGTCSIRYLFVPAPMRNQGHGSRIMRAVEREAVARRCGQIVLETHDFQAPGFYRRLGFEIVGAIDDYPRGYRYFMLLKRLAADRSVAPDQQA